MSLDLTEVANSTGGAWYKLFDKDEHPPLEGILLDIEERDRTDPDGNVVYKKGTTTPRKEWVILVQTDLRDPENPEDDGLRKSSLNESAQRALGKAVKDSGSKEYGGKVKIGVKTNAADKFSQAEYQAKYTAPVATISVDVDEDEF